MTKFSLLSWALPPADSLVGSIPMRPACHFVSGEEEKMPLSQLVYVLTQIFRNQFLEIWDYFLFILKQQL